MNNDFIFLLFPHLIPTALRLFDDNTDVMIKLMLIILDGGFMEHLADQVT